MSSNYWKTGRAKCRRKPRRDWLSCLPAPVCLALILIAILAPCLLNTARYEPDCLALSANLGLPTRYNPTRWACEVEEQPGEWLALDTQVFPGNELQDKLPLHSLYVLLVATVFIAVITVFNTLRIPAVPC